MGFEIEKASLGTLTLQGQAELIHLFLSSPVPLCRAEHGTPKPHFCFVEVLAIRLCLWGPGDVTAGAGRGKSQKEVAPSISSRGASWQPRTPGSLALPSVISCRAFPGWHLNTACGSVCSLAAQLPLDASQPLFLHQWSGSHPYFLQWLLPKELK